MDVMDKRRALQLAYQIVTDKRNGNRYAFTAITRVDKPDIMFTYSDMLEGLRVMFKELDDDQTKPVLQKPLTVEELHALIDAGDEAVIYCESKDDPQTYAHIVFGGRVIDREAESVDARRLVYPHYRKHWRAWVSRPTDEERAAAPWEGDGDAHL